jgi:hypothetical protein
MKGKGPNYESIRSNLWAYRLIIALDVAAYGAELHHYASKGMDQP